MVSVGSGGQSHKTVSTNHKLFGRERRAEAVSNRGPSAYQPYNALPLCQTGSIVQELCESRGGRPELSVLTSLLVSVDVKNY